MNTEEREIFRELEPPPGGVERFRRRLGASRPVEQRWPRRSAIAGLAVIAMAVVTLTLRQQTDPRMPASGESRREAQVQQAPEFDRLLGRPGEPARTRIAVNDTSVAVSELPSANPSIRIYRIQGD